MKCSGRYLSLFGFSREYCFVCVGEEGGGISSVNIIVCLYCLFLLPQKVIDSVALD